MSEQQVVIGVDAHKRTHTLVAADALGRSLGERTVAATSEGHMLALEWASQWRERRFAVEDCRHVTRRLEGDLLRAGERLVRVPTKLMSGVRRSSRECGKSDPLLRPSRGRARRAVQRSPSPVRRCGPSRPPG